MRIARVVCASLTALAALSCLHAQELEPRAYSSSPKGTNFFAVALGRTEGAILFDPSLPLTDVEAVLDAATLGYGRTFSIRGRQALVAVALPYSWGHVEGELFEQFRRVRRSGLADLRVKASVNFVGPKAMTPEEFRKAPKATIVGASLALQLPTGEYDETKLINLGTNRWALKPEVGVSVPVGHWYLDAYAGAWFFGTNDEFYPGGSERKQDPLIAVQGHASYTFANRAWIAFDANWFGGGEATVDGGPPSTRQSSSRLGATYSFPIAAHQSIKVAASTGASTRIGSDFDTFLVGWQLTWFDRPKAVIP